jgi:serine protease
MNKSILSLGLLISFAIGITTSNAKTSRYFLQPGVTTADYAANTIIFKVKPAYRTYCSESAINIPAFQKLLVGMNTIRVNKIYPRHTPPAQLTNELGQKFVDLSLIYELQYASNADLIKSINSIINSGIVEYAEPKFIPTVSFIPNDPQLGNQSFLGKIQAYDAWDIVQGDTNTVIGITDTGSDMDHPDLVNKIKLNYADPINGIDDDGDGFVDNYRGWDVGESDNNPQVGNCGTCSHGSHVSGCAAAQTDNNIGVASPGYKCMYLPVKIANASGSLTKAYEGIVYAADHGCQIINCSWGGQGGGTYGQDIVDYATINKNSLVVVAAGNNASNLNFYPAAYNYALCVAATNINDSKANFSNYGGYIDICAPGSGIFSTYFDNAYSSQSGTSMASPIVAGCAGIVKSYFPSYNAQQIGEQLRVTADNIYNIPSNATYLNQLGSGRVNLFSAVTLNSVSVRVNNINIVDNNDNILVVNDTMRITGNIINYLDPTTNLILTLTTTSPYVTILDGSTTVGAMSTLSTTNNLSDPFTVKINPNAPQNAVVAFKLLIQDGSYNDFQLFNATVNVDYLNITINEVITTNTSNGGLCYNSQAQTDGLGFSYPGDTSLTYEAGFMVGINGNVSDNVRGTATTNDDDFAAINVIQKHEPGIWSDYDTYGKFNDQLNTNPIGVDVSYRSMSWSNAPDNKYHIFEYTIKNTNSTALNNLYAGIMSDWDIMAYANNKAAEDLALKMGYIYSTDVNGLYGGIKLLTSGGFKHYAIDNITGGGGGVDISGGYSSTLKYQTLSTNRANAGGAGTGNDVIDVVSTGPFSIAAGDSIIVAFAMIAGSELGSIQSSAIAAQNQYNLVTSIQENPNSELVVGEAYPNPSSDNLTIPIFLKNASTVNVSLVDNLGREVLKFEYLRLAAGQQQLNLSMNDLTNGLYHYVVRSKNALMSGSVVKQ